MATARQRHTFQPPPLLAIAPNNPPPPLPSTGAQRIHPLKLDSGDPEPIQLKGVARVSNAEFLNELREIQAAGLHECRKLQEERERQPRPTRGTKIVPMTEMIRDQVERMMNEQPPQVAAAPAPAAAPAIDMREVRGMVETLLREYKHQLRGETKRLVQQTLERQEPRPVAKVGESSVLSETLEQSLRRAVNRQFQAEPLTELDMQVEQCGSLRSRGDGTLIREKVLGVEDIEAAPQPPEQLDPLDMLTPGGRLQRPTQRFLSEEDIEEEDQEDAVELPVSEAALAREERNAAMEVLMQRKKISEEESKQRAQCLLGIMSHELSQAEQKANQLDQRLKQRDTRLDQVIDEFELQRQEIEAKRLIQKAELAELELQRAKNKEAELERDYEVEDIFAENKLLYADIAQYKQKTGGEIELDDQDGDEPSMLGLDEINKLYSKKPKGALGVQKTTQIDPKLRKKKKQEQQPVKPQLGGGGLKGKKGKPKAEANPKPRLVGVRQVEAKRSLRLEQQINAEMGSTFAFLERVISKHQQI